MSVLVKSEKPTPFKGGSMSLEQIQKQEEELFKLLYPNVDREEFEILQCCNIIRTELKLIKGYIK